jgi:hypothetical protein
MKRTTLVAKPVLVAAYAAAILILVDQAAEFVVSVYPPRLAAVEWRFAAYGLLIGRTTALVVADLLVQLAAVGLGHRRVLRASVVVHAVAGLFLLVGLGGFALDALQLRRSLQPGGPVTLESLELASAQAAGIVVLGLVYCVVVAVAAHRAAQAMPKPMSSPADPMLVVNTGGRRDG